MKKLAVFVHYSRNGYICPNALLYAHELRKNFDDVIISSNIKITDEKLICLQFTTNAYDFGYFYQALEYINAYENYDIIGFFNDSNYIIKPIDNVINWCFDNTYSFCGITDSYDRRPEITEENQYHIQSHFLIFKGHAIKLLKRYLELHTINDVIGITQDDHTKRLNAIITYEIGLSIYMTKHNIQIGSYFSANKFIKKISNFPITINMHLLLWKELIDNDYPLIKRKIINKSFSVNDYNSLSSQKNMQPMKTAYDIILKNGDKNFIKTIN